MAFWDFLNGKSKQEVSPVPEITITEPAAPTPVVDLVKMDEKVAEVKKKRATKKAKKTVSDRIDNSDLNTLVKKDTKVAASSGKKAAKKTAKKTAAKKTKKGKAEEPYIRVVEVTFDKENPRYGSFEFDFNQAFVMELMKAGYQGREDNDIVENWFTDVCRNVAKETYEQEVAQTPGLARKMKVKNISETHKSIE
jgi:hypothetical protein